MLRRVNDRRRKAAAWASASLLAFFLLALATPLTASLRATASTTIVAPSGAQPTAVPTPTPTPPPARTLRLAPSSGLVDGQYVKVTIAGFTPGTGAGFRQCSAAPTSTANCTIINNNVVTVDNGGGGSTYIPIYAGGDPLLKPGTGNGTIVCDQGHPCVLVAVSNGNDLTSAAFANLTFGPSPDACPPPPANALLGGGSASAYRAIYQWESTVCQPPYSLSIGYAVNNSVDGIGSFLGGLTDFAVSGPGAALPVSGAAAPPAPTFRYAPMTGSAVVLAYRIYDRRGPQITSLKLTPGLIAQIFTGNASTLNWSTNAAINTLNPGLQFPGREVAFSRAEHSAQTFVFTSWMAAAAPTIWTGGPKEIFSEPSVQGVTGNVGVQVVNPQPDWGTGNIGFMDSSTAAFYGLPTVEITKPDGSSPIAADPTTIQKALGDAALNADGTLAINYTNPDAAAYPMPLPTYMLAPTNTIAPDRGSQLAAFLKYVVQAGQEVLPPGYAVLSPNLVTESLQVASSIPAPPPPTPTPSASATLTPTSTPSPTPLVHQPPPYLPPPLPRSSVFPTFAAPTAAPCPATSATAAATPSASSTPGAAPSSSATATPSPGASAPTSTGCSPGAVQAVVTAPPASGAPPPGPDQRAELAMLVGQGDQAVARFVLPGVVALAFLGMLFGGPLQVFARRRFQVP